MLSCGSRGVSGGVSGLSLGEGSASRQRGLILGEGGRMLFLSAFSFQHSSAARSDWAVYESRYRVWGPQRHRGASGAVPDVSASDSRLTSAKIPQLGSRSAIQVPSMASQSSSTRGEGNRDGSLRAA